MVRLQTLDLRIGVRVPASQPNSFPLRFASAIMKRRLLLALVLVAVPSVAQSAGALFQKPPVGVEGPLKSRVKEFFDLQMAGKFRQAEGLVCSDTKDHYYVQDKQRPKTAEVGRVILEEGNQQARVVVEMDVELTTMVGKLVSKYPATTFWRLEEGQWCYYVPKESRDRMETPFGVMHNPGGQSTSPGAPPGQPVDLATLRKAVSPSKPGVVLKGYERSSDEVLLRNSQPGPVRIQLVDTGFPGLRLSMKDTEIAGNSSSALVVEYVPANQEPKPAIKIRIFVSPFGQVIDLPVTFQPKP